MMSSAVNPAVPAVNLRKESKNLVRANVLTNLVIDVRTNIASTNIQEFNEKARNFLANINVNLEDDSDFDIASNDCKILKEAESAIRETIKKVTAGNTNVENVLALATELADDFKHKRTTLEGLISDEKNRRKQEIVDQAMIEIVSLINAHPPFLPMLKISMPMAALKERIELGIKNKKTLSGVQKGANAVLTTIRMELEAEIERLSGRLKLIPDDRAYLFHDRITLVASHSNLEEIVFNRVHDDDRRKAVEAAKIQVLHEERRQQELQAAQVTREQGYADRREHHVTQIRDNHAECNRNRMHAGATNCPPEVHVHESRPDRGVGSDFGYVGHANRSVDLRPAAQTTNSLVADFRIVLRCTRDEAIRIGQRIKQDYPQSFVSVKTGAGEQMKENKS